MRTARMSSVSVPASRKCARQTDCANNFRGAAAGESRRASTGCRNGVGLLRQRVLPLFRLDRRGGLNGAESLGQAERAPSTSGVVPMNASVNSVTSDCGPRPVLMIPLRRCGSHALRLRLNFNPQFYSPYPLHIVVFMPMVQLYGDLADDRAYFRLVTDVIGLQAAGMVKWPAIVFDAV